MVGTLSRGIIWGVPGQVTGSVNNNAVKQMTIDRIIASYGLST